MKQLRTKVKILKNYAVTEDYFKAVILAPRIAISAVPGQFLNIKVNSGTEPLLRRPISIHKISGDKIEILYEVLGPATEILSRSKPGELLDIIGPLGNGFNLPTTNYQLRTNILIAGGMGVAPLLFLAEKLKEHKAGGRRQKIMVLIGARSKSQILCEKEFKDIGYDVKIATDDGSRGFKGRVTDLLRHLLRPTTYDLRPNIYACGPKPMLKEISRLSREYEIPAQISLEEHMACGIGACLGCVVNTRDGYKRVCKDGPIFSAEDIIL